jgi:hypothetical protein
MSFMASQSRNAATHAPADHSPCDRGGSRLLRGSGKSDDLRLTDEGRAKMELGAAGLRPAARHPRFSPRVRSRGAQQTAEIVGKGTVSRSARQRTRFGRGAASRISQPGSPNGGPRDVVAVMGTSLI